MKRTQPRSELAIAVYNQICKHGGRTAKQIGLALNQPTRCINEALVAIEGDGDLVYEDDNGRLYSVEKHTQEPDKCMWLSSRTSLSAMRYMAFIRMFVKKKFSRLSAIDGELVLQESDDAVNWVTARNEDVDQV